MLKKINITLFSLVIIMGIVIAGYKVYTMKFYKPESNSIVDTIEKGH